MCGCGETTTKAARTRYERGIAKGQHLCYVVGHDASTGRRYTDARGYVHVYAPDHPRANGNHVLEHLLVAERALGRPIPLKCHVHHVNGNPSDNRPHNLVICEDMSYHMLLHKRQDASRQRGAKNNNSKLTADDVRAIRARYAPGAVTLTSLGREFGVSREQIRKIVTRENWRHV